VSPYPSEVFADARSALFLFGAAFLGRNDATHARRAGVTATVVDTDGLNLRRMRRLYPADWKFVHEDAYEYASASAGGFDVVSVDPFTNQIERCVEWLHVFARLAVRALTLTIHLGQTLPTLDGWRSARMGRGPRAKADWLVLTR
jgi:hypothetical protein